MNGDRTAVIILQARLGSQRLPGKVLAPLGAWPLIEFCLARLVAADVGPIVLATTTAAADQALVELGRRGGVATWTGPDDDVLGRFAQAVEAYPQACHVIRATGDNPFVDIGTAGRILKALAEGADYAVEEALPVGTAVEGVRRTVLLRAAREADTSYDREHVTSWVRRTAGLVRVSPLAPDDLRAPDLRLTVDTPADLAYARRLVTELEVGRLEPRLAPLTAVIAAARRLPAREVA